MMGNEHKGKPRAWQRMLSGRRLDLLEPDPADIAIEDIAHGLARVARWNGQTTGSHAYSVAQHSLVVEEIAAALNHKVTNAERLAALLHDAPEYVIGDLISPFKAAIGLDYKSFELRLLGAIHERFGLPSVSDAALTQAIKHADGIAAYFEATALAGFSEAEAKDFFGKPELPTDLAAKLSRLGPLATRDAEKQFLMRFAELAGNLD